MTKPTDFCFSVKSLPSISFSLLFWQTNNNPSSLHPSHHHLLTINPSLYLYYYLQPATSTDVLSWHPGFQSWRTSAQEEQAVVWTEYWWGGIHAGLCWDISNHSSVSWLDVWWLLPKVSSIKYCLINVIPNHTASHNTKLEDFFAHFLKCVLINIQSMILNSYFLMIWSLPVL